MSFELPPPKRNGPASKRKGSKGKPGATPPKLQGTPPAGGRPAAKRDSSILVQNLSVADARHLVKNEGGELTPAAIAWRAVSIVVTMGLLAWAIARGDATTWHLLLPYLGMYVVMIVSIPVAYAITRMHGLRDESRKSLRLWWLLPAIFAAVEFGRSRYAGADFVTQAWGDVEWFARSVVESRVHWAMLWAAANALMEFPQRLRNLRLYGPPFMGASLGCAMRLVVPLFGCFLLPFIAQAIETKSTWWFPWGVWLTFVVAEVLALWMHWDLQTRLRKYDAERQGEPAT
ncbi:MAG: hypothetical protein ACRCT8_04875 [Lacipirellulaceae bacterium]